MREKDRKGQRFKLNDVQFIIFECMCVLLFHTENSRKWNCKIFLGLYDAENDSHLPSHTK